MHVIEITNAELMETITHRAKEMGITNGAIVSFIGGADSFTISTMPASDATADVITDYDVPAEMHGAGEIRDGAVHVHATMAVEGDRGVAGHLHRAQIGTWFARAYVLPLSGRVHCAERAAAARLGPGPGHRSAVRVRRRERTRVDQAAVAGHRRGPAEYRLRACGARGAGRLAARPRRRAQREAAVVDSASAEGMSRRTRRT